MATDTSSNEINRQFRLAARPRGMVKETDLDYAEATVPVPGPGEVLVRTRYISLDPSMRGQMENRADYVAPLQIGDVMRAGAAGEVVESNNPKFPVGTLVTGSFGMQDWCVSDGRTIPLRTFPADVDGVTALGVLGGTGMTAYFGLLEIGQPKAGDVVVVSGAAGATGSIAGQIAKIKGCHVIGIAGAAEKCRWLMDELGFDAAINYKTQNVAEELDRLCPQGINLYFDNVGGEILDACLARIAMNARVVICGGITRYNTTGPIPGPRNYFNLVYRRARMEGFIVIDYAARFAEASIEMKRWIDAGLIRHHATVIDGFRYLPKTLVDLFAGVNTGKLMVRVD
ncbi:MAG: NADP-dependent oxidoreductase [Gammaproteobacteria bacterium]|nr:NADP-dependent oxidoreductase [Gammaproteobacteria bacterium]